MSWSATAWASKVKTGSPAMKLVLLTLANFADDEGYCFPSQKTLAEITECGERSIRRYLDKLESMGVIRRVRRHRGDGSRTSDGVFLCMENLPAKLTTGQIDHRPNEADPTGQALAGHESPDEASDSSNSSSKEKPKQMAFNPETGAIENIPPELMEKWAEAYPAISVEQEIARAEAWIISNPKNRKSDYPRFLTNWLSRAQDRAPRVPVQQGRASSHRTAPHRTAHGSTEQPSAVSASEPRNDKEGYYNGVKIVQSI